MPPDTAQRAATAAYRAQMQAVSLDTIRQTVALWRLVDPAAVDKAWPVVAQALREVVARNYSASSALAVQYLQRHAAAAGVVIHPLLAGPLPAAQVDTALTVTGPVAVKVAARAGMLAPQASATALVRLSGAASRLAMAGGRNTVERTVHGNDGIAGWRRVTGAKPCDWCLMLAGRGAVYKSEATAGGLSTYHDHDQCQAEPEYRA